MTLAAEVQQSDITAGEVLCRSQGAVKAGATPTWFADMKNPPWAFQVPHVETNERMGMDPGTWTVATGPRMLESERCRPGARIDCPDGRNWCGRSHVLWVPMPGVTVDAVVEWVPAGELVAVDTSTRQGTILARPRDRDVWFEEHPPLEDSSTIRVPSQRIDDGIIRHPDYSARKLRARLARADQQSDAPRPDADAADAVDVDSGGASPTVLSRMLAAGISEIRARQHLAAGCVLVDGVPVTSLDQLAPPPARIVITGR